MEKEKEVCRGSCDALAAGRCEVDERFIPKDDHITLKLCQQLGRSVGGANVHENDLIELVGGVLNDRLETSSSSCDVVEQRDDNAALRQIQILSRSLTQSRGKSSRAIGRSPAE